jgi:uncharacterized SAM-binding protein YcdF (DUF218 family)
MLVNIYGLLMTHPDQVDLDLIDASAPGRGASDVIFVFGSLHVNAADVAAERYHQGDAPWVMVTGGESPARPGHFEAERLAQILLDRGVPEPSIIVESHSTTTAENVAFSVPLLREKLGDVRRVTAVVKWFHRRALVLLAAGLPSVERIYAADYEPLDVVTGKHLLRQTWAETSPKSCRNETAYMTQIAQAGFDLLVRDGDGWVRSIQRSHCAPPSGTAHCR